MSRGKISFNYSILFIICQFFLCLGSIFTPLGAINASAASVDNFYFDSFDAEYHLSQNYDGTSRLEVVETLVAVFPEYRQNKGICRRIPFTNLSGTNITMPMLTYADIEVTRNGLYEPIYSIDRYSDYYEVCTGDESYVLGRQEYTLSYEFSKVITDFGYFQELYWDTNGNGWSQEFKNLSATVYFDDKNTLAAYSGKQWCYVGSYGENGQDRCEITNLENGVMFSTKNLAKNENLTFDIEFAPGAFVIPEPEIDYTPVYTIVIVAIISALCVLPSAKRFISSREKRSFYKGYFIKPEYQPSKDYSIAEMSEIYLENKKNTKVGILLDMIVNGRVAIIKKTGQIFTTKSSWALLVKNLDNARVDELGILAILNGGVEVSVGDIISLNSRSGSYELVKIAKKVDNSVLEALKKDKLVESKYKIGDADQSKATPIWVSIVFTAVFVFPMSVAFYEVTTPGYIPAISNFVFTICIIAIISLAIVAKSKFNHESKKIVNLTTEGLKASRYMDGLKHYIRMAEANRIKFLQSVETADTSPEGIVKLYEKLLPYAAIFGLEKSWMKELEKYYNEANFTPEWSQDGVSATDIIIVAGLANIYAAQASTISSGSSSSSFSSSSSSGGGGGGFSGGGGGGGGGGGR